LEWIVTLPPDVTEWTFPELPLSADLRQMIAQQRSASVTLDDYSAFAGYVDTAIGIAEYSKGDLRPYDWLNLFGSINSVGTEEEGAYTVTSRQTMHRAPSVEHTSRPLPELPRSFR
jgi:hypothetical protein